MKISDSMIEVYKTNVERKTEAAKLIGLLGELLPGSRITFDLHDCDKVLRVEGKNFDAQKVMLMVREKGFCCTELE